MKSCTPIFLYTFIVVFYILLSLVKNKNEMGITITNLKIGAPLVEVGREEEKGYEVYTYC